jgi:hypothetical protein
LSDDIASQVKGMAALVLTSGRLSEFHEKNLRMYPLIYFDQVREIVLDYDLSIRHDAEVDDKNNVKVKKPLQHCFISYNLKINEDANQHLPKRFEALENSVRTLLWKELPIEIYFNDKIVYKSKKNGK